MTRNITRAVVIGGGTMGGGIAAHFANAGIPVYLLDIAPQGMLERMKKHKPSMFFTEAASQLVTAGHLDEHEQWIAEGDWIVEAIFENMDAKRELVARIDRLRKPGTIVSSNTSGLPISQLAVNASDAFRQHFLGTHFFNPPRYMKLLEIIPTNDTAPEVTTFVRDFAERRLGKGVVLCKDTPNFIANRLASVGGVSLTDFVLANDYTVEEADAIAGPLIGRPKTAAFRLQDLVGLDVASAVSSNLYGLIEGDESREVLRSERFETLRRSQIEKGRLGDKTKQGFYKKDGKTILSLDFKTGEYRERIEPRIASLEAASKIPNLGERLKFVLALDDKAGALARHAVYGALGYASRRVPEISDDLVSIDRAVRWGFSHDLGPFELWDLLGVRETADAMEQHGVAVAPWVREMLASGSTEFYRDGSVYDPIRKVYVPVASDPRQISLRDCRVVKANGGGTLRDLGDRVLGCEFHDMNGLDDAVAELESGDWCGLVIGGDGGDFSAGVNESGSFAAAVQMRVRFAAKPVVAAPFGRVLGGGAEVCMAASRVVAAAETYMGLAGTGACKEMVRRVVSPAMRRTPGADALPLVQTVLQTIASARVSASAAEARELGFLGEGDRIVMNRDHLLFEAKREVLDMAAAGYAPPVRGNSCFAAGRDVLAALKAGVHVLRQGGYISEHDDAVSGRLAHVLCGGELSSGEWVSEQYLLDLERMESA